MAVKIITFGCKLNQAESEKISADFYSLASQIKLPDVNIINSCAVTIKAEREVRQKISQLKRQFPQARIVVTGCFFKQDWPGVDMWVANKEKNKLAKIKNINFTADIIVGFPGETVADFEDTLAVVKHIGFSKVHVFKYSPRLGTSAVLLPAQIDEKTKQERGQKFIELSKQTADKVKKKFIGKNSFVLWETKKAGYWHGFTENYLRIRKKISDQEDLTNKIEEIKIKQQNLTDYNG